MENIYDKKKSVCKSCKRKCQRATNNKVWCSDKSSHRIYKPKNRRTSI